MRRLGIYIWECIVPPFKPSWAAATGLFGTSLGGLAVTLLGSIHFIENVSLRGQAINGILTTVIYVVSAWIIILALRAIFVSPFRLWEREHDLRIKAESLVCHPFIDIKQSALYFDPTQQEAWMAKIQPTKTVTHMQICLDNTAYSGGLGHNFWSPKRRLILKRDVNIVAGVAISIDLIELDNSSPTRCWRWATVADGNERPLMSITCHRCRLVVITEQDTVLDYFDFVISFHYEEKPPPVRDGKTPARYEKTPSLIGEHQFLYAREWNNIDVTASHS